MIVLPLGIFYLKMFVTNFIQNKMFRNVGCLNNLGSVSAGDFSAQLVDILVFPSLASYMLTSFNFSLLNLGIFSKFL